MSKGNSGHFKGTRGETISRNKTVQEVTLIKTLIIMQILMM